MQDRVVAEVLITMARARTLGGDRFSWRFVRGAGLRGIPSRISHARYRGSGVRAIGCSISTRSPRWSSATSSASRGGRIIGARWTRISDHAVGASNRGFSRVHAGDECGDARTVLEHLARFARALAPGRGQADDAAHEKEKMKAVSVKAVHRAPRVIERVSSSSFSDGRHPSCAGR